MSDKKQQQNDASSVFKGNRISLTKKDEETKDIASEHYMQEASSVAEEPVAEPPVVTPEVEAPVEEVKAEEQAPEEVKEPEPVKEEIKTISVKPVVTSTVQEPTTTDFEATINRIRANPTSYQRALLDTLDTYIDRMKPNRPVTAEEGYKYQNSLYRAIMNTLNADISLDDFRVLWSVLLLYFKEYNAGVFHERYVCRFNEAWRGNPDELLAYNRLLNLLMNTAKAKSIKEVTKVVSLQKTTDGFPEKAKQKLLALYGV